VSRVFDVREHGDHRDALATEVGWCVAVGIAVVWIVNRVEKAVRNRTGATG